MTIGEIMDNLIVAKNYNEVRATVSDDFIEMAKVMLSNYKYIAQKEEEYQKMLSDKAIIDLVFGKID